MRLYRCTWENASIVPLCLTLWRETRSFDVCNPHAHEPLSSTVARRAHTCACRSLHLYITGVWQSHAGHTCVARCRTPTHLYMSEYRTLGAHTHTHTRVARCGLPSEPVHTQHMSRYVSHAGRTQVLLAADYQTHAYATHVRVSKQNNMCLNRTLGTHKCCSLHILMCHCSQLAYTHCV